MSERSVQADVVKKASLKYKVSKLRGTTGSNLQGPKTYKEFFVVFRAVSGEKKELEIYNNERRFHEASPPKVFIDLMDATAIHVMNGKRSEFYVELNNGGMCLFEAKNPEESVDWVSCLNAVVFAKAPNGEAILQYDVDLQESELLSYQGPSILEMKDGELIVKRKDNNAEVVKWRLSHIRSFKAKKRMLTIYSGSRSSTGVGEFFFKCDRSVEVTHAIETVVGAMAKDKKSSRSGHSPHPPSSTQNGNIRNWSSTLVGAIPDFQPPGVYEDIPESEFDEEGYGRLNFKDLPHGTSSPPSLASPEREDSPRQGAGVVAGRARHTSPSPRPTRPLPSRTSAPLVRRGGRRDYEDLDLPEEDIDSVPPVAPETYSRLDREKSPAPARNMSPARKMSPPEKSSLFKSGKKLQPPPTPDRVNVPLPSRPHVPPPAPDPSDVPTEVPDGIYSVVSKPKKRTAATVRNSRPPKPSTKASSTRPGSNPDFSSVGHEAYGKLDRRVPTSSVPLPQEDYDTVDLVGSKVSGAVAPMGPEEYGKLEHATTKEFSHVSPADATEQYGKLELATTSATVSVSSHYEFEDDDVPPPLPSTSSAAAAASITEEEYGRLHQFNGAPSTAPSGASRPQLPSPMQEEYGRLDRSIGKNASILATTEDEYGHLEQVQDSSLFNPYSTLSGEEIKVAAQTTSKKTAASRSSSDGSAGEGGSDSHSLRPPPGYENTEIKQPSRAYRASVSGRSQLLVGKPQAPPRGPNTSPTTQKKGAHGYVNVDEKGQVKKVSGPSPPAKPHLDTSVASSQPHPKSTSNKSSLRDKSRDVNEVSFFSVRRKPPVSSSAYEDTETLNFGIFKQSPTASQRHSVHLSEQTSSTSAAILPPSAPTRGPLSVRGNKSASSALSENSNKPSVTQKPSKMKVTWPPVLAD